LQILKYLPNQIVFSSIRFLLPRIGMQTVQSLVKFIGVAAAIWTVCASGFIMFGATQSQVSTQMALPDGTMTRQEHHSSTSLLERQGWAGVFGFILWPLSLPIMIAIAGARAAWLYKQGLLWTMAGVMLLLAF